LVKLGFLANILAAKVAILRLKAVLSMMSSVMPKSRRWRGFAQVAT